MATVSAYAVRLFNKNILQSVYVVVQMTLLDIDRDSRFEKKLMKEERSDIKSDISYYCIILTIFLDFFSV